MQTAADRISSTDGGFYETNLFFDADFEKTREHFLYAVKKIFDKAFDFDERCVIFFVVISIIG